MKEKSQVQGFHPVHHGNGNGGGGNSIE